MDSPIVELTERNLILIAPFEPSPRPAHPLPLSGVTREMNAGDRPFVFEWPVARCAVGSGKLLVETAVRLIEELHSQTK